MNFTRVDGTGNTFLIADLRDLGEADRSRAIEDLRNSAAARCDAADVHGLLLIGPAANAWGASMVIVNRDGSRAQMCGNGLRCVAAFVARRGGGRELVIGTDAGPLSCEVVEIDEGTATVRVHMGPASLGNPRRPSSGRGRVFETVKIGNPHAVHFVGPGEDPLVLAPELGPGVELDAAYAPEGINVGFARVEADGSMRLAVWERGVGLTPACGTGACAAAVAAVRTRRAPEGVDQRVTLAGGTLTIHVPSDPRHDVVMTGPAREIAAGSPSGP